MSNYIKSLQNVTLSLSSSQTTNTATITSVNTSNILIIYQGSTQTGSTTDHSSDQYAVIVTNGTTLTINRATAASNAITAKVTVVEFTASVINSATQTGVITIASGQPSNTATISAVGTYAAVVWLGQYEGSTDTNSYNAYATLALTNSTTVTATREASPAITLAVAYLVIDLTSELIKSVQPISYNSSAAGTSFTTTISSVATANTFLLYGGVSSASANETPQTLQNISLTNATTVTIALSSSNTASRTVNFTALEFNAGYLNQAVQRGTIALGSSLSKTATITSVNTGMAFANWCGYEVASTANGANNYRPSQVLTNSTTITTAVNSSSASTNIITSYEVVEFGNSVGTATGTSTVSGIGAPQFPAFGFSQGSGTATATSASTFSGVGSSAGTATVSGAGTIGGSVGSSTGSATVSGIGKSTAVTIGTSTGSSTVTAIGAPIFTSAGSAAGTSSVTGVNASQAKGVGSAVGVATVNGYDTSFGTAIGISTVSGIGISTAMSVGTSAGSATVIGDAGYIGTTSGVATVSGVGLMEFIGTGNAAGMATVTAIPIQLVPAIGSATGTATVSGVGNVQPITPPLPPTEDYIDILLPPIEYPLAA